MTRKTRTSASLTGTLRRARLRALELEPKVRAALVDVMVAEADRAARNFTKHATDHFAASAARRSADVLALASLPQGERRRMVASLGLRGAAPDLQSTSTMVALYPRPEEAAAIAAEGGEPPEILHVTLVYIGDTEEGEIPAIVDALRSVAGKHAPLAGTVGGVGLFAQDTQPGILLPDVPGLVELRVAVTDALHRAGVDYATEHGFTPHMTRHYGMGMPETDAGGEPLHFDSITVARGDKVIWRAAA